mgnify:CR=1 FL=1
MISDPKINRFLDSFPKQWLQLHRVGQFPPDPELYPDYDKWLEESMVLETVGYFGEVFAKNLPLREFLVGNNLPVTVGFRRQALYDGTQSNFAGDLGVGEA